MFFKTRCTKMPDSFSISCIDNDAINMLHWFLSITNYSSNFSFIFEEIIIVFSHDEKWRFSWKIFYLSFQAKHSISKNLISSDDIIQQQSDFYNQQFYKKYVLSRIFTYQEKMLDINKNSVFVKRNLCLSDITQPKVYHINLLI